MKPFFQQLRPLLIPRKSKRESFVRQFLRKISALRLALGVDYRAWIKQNEPNKQALENQETWAKSFALQPTISLVVVINSPSTKDLHEMIHSVLNQSYQNWELCLASEPSNPNDIQKVLKNCAAQDERIKIKAAAANHESAPTTNSAIEMAQGEFIGFLDQKDRLAPFALFAIVEALNQYPETDLFYSDEDQLSGDGLRRSNPIFKPAFSIDYLRAYNYIQHFLVVRRTSGSQIDWLRAGCDGAQFYDLSLRSAESARLVTHIPQVLIHIRQMPGMAAESATSQANQRILREHLERCNLKALVQLGATAAICQVKYEIHDAPLISIIIPNHEHAEVLRRCVNSILEISTYTQYEILIVENNSQEPETFNLYQELQQRDARVRVLEYHQQPFNYSNINNYGVSMARGKFLLFLNNDTQTITADWLERLLEYALRPDVGVVGARLYFPNMLIQHTGVILGLGAGAGHYFVGYPRGNPGYRNNLLTPLNLSAVTAACMMMRRTVFDEVGGFGEKYRLAFGDIDLCLKVRQKKYLVVCTPYAELIHYESITRGFDDSHENKTRFSNESNLLLEQWVDFLAQGDPYYNPNLTLARGDFSLRSGVCPQRARSEPGVGVGR